MCNKHNHISKKNLGEERNEEKEIVRLTWFSYQKALTMGFLENLEQLYWQETG